MKIQSENFLTIQGWMRTDLNLKGNELMIFALIYGFSQDGESWFKGSRKYIADWVGCTPATVSNALKALVKRGLMQKRTREENGCTLNDYRALVGVEKFDGGVKNYQGGIENFSRGGVEKNRPHNIEEDNIEKKEKTKAKKSEASEVIAYLNEKAKKKYRESKSTMRHIIARLNEGFTVEDMKRVIDIKVKQWGKDAYWSKYLRPETLFGTKFEGYLNEGSIDVQGRDPRGFSRFNK